MAPKKGLGRGLDLLLSQGSAGMEAAKEVDKGEAEAGKKSTSRTTSKSKQQESKKADTMLPINKIEPNKNQPRKIFDEDALKELSDSIKQYGLLQPIIVQKKEDYYEIIAGERRWRACKKAGLKEVPVVIKDLTEKDILKISLIENLQRENLNPIEEARAYQLLKKEHHLKQDEIAESVSKSRTAIANTMRLLKLDERVQNMILDNDISSGHGRSLLALENLELQYKTAVQILDEGLSVRETEKLIRKLLEAKDTEEAAPAESKEVSQEQQMIQFFENRMKEILGSKVSITQKKNNKGKIEIEYYSKDELERLIDMIQSIH